MSTVDTQIWNMQWRQRSWAQLGLLSLDQEAAAQGSSDKASADRGWDIIVIGGGITGAGILREATRLGLKVLLVDQRDFAWGTSSRSSKLVHGGLRYLKEGKVSLTRDSVRERQRLLGEGPGLIDPLGFLLTNYQGDSPGRWVFRAGLSVYDLLALQWSHRRYTPEELRLLAPHISQEGLEGGLQYGDAQTDDARLVLRIIREAVRDGGMALNYVGAQGLLRDEKDQVVGVRLVDMSPRKPGDERIREVVSRDVYARVVINATGAWADRLRGQLGENPVIRPLRGSHLVFPTWRLPVAQAISFLHPLDHRPVFILPWEGITLVGTTDVDHNEGTESAAWDNEPRVSAEEVSYLMAAVDAQFPSLRLGLDDVIACFAGIRPIIASGTADPSRESRDHVVWQEHGLLTVTGGKLTTFRLIALDALKAVQPRLPHMPEPNRKAPVLDQVDMTSLAGIRESGLDDGVRKRLLGRYGAEAQALMAAAQAGELKQVPGTQTLWAELRWAARAEGVVHLEDLLLRRVRLGLLLPDGGSAHLPRIRTICQPELGWDDARWEAEERAYRALWENYHQVPDQHEVPDWRPALGEARERRRLTKRPWHTRKSVQFPTLAGLVASLAVLIWAWRRHGWQPGSKAPTPARP